MEKKIILIGITGADGTGKTTLATMIAHHYGGTYHSVHQSLSALFQETKGEVPKDRAEFVDFSNSLRFESKDPAIAVRGIIDGILLNGIPGVHVIESFALPDEISYADEGCNGKAQFMLFGIDAPLEHRYEWTNKSKQFKPLTIPNAEVMYAIEARDWFDAKEWQPNIEACLKLVSEDHLFFNDNEGRGFVKKIFLTNAKPLIDAVLATPH